MAVKEKGQSLVELAISFVFIMYLLSGAVEFGILFFQYVQLRDAAQEGALYGSMFPHDTVSIERRVRYASQTPINLTSSEVSVIILVNDGEKDNALACENDALTVTARYHHKIFMPFLPILLGQDVIMLNGTAIDTVLSPVCS